MKKREYYVKSANWTCQVNMTNDPIYTNPIEMMIEAGTRALELMFPNQTDELTLDFQSDVTLVSIIDPTTNEEFVENHDTMSPPQPLISILIEVCDVKDVDDQDKHFFMKTENIIQNGSLTGIQENFYKFQNEYYKNNPKLKKLLSTDPIKNKIIFKYKD